MFSKNNKYPAVNDLDIHDVQSTGSVDRWMLVTVFHCFHDSDVRRVFESSTRGIYTISPFIHSCTPPPPSVSSAFIISSTTGDAPTNGSAPRAAGSDNAVTITRDSVIAASAAAARRLNESIVLFPVAVVLRRSVRVLTVRTTHSSTHTSKLDDDTSHTDRVLVSAKPTRQTRHERRLNSHTAAQTNNARAPVITVFCPPVTGFLDFLHRVLLPRHETVVL